MKKLIAMAAFVAASIYSNAENKTNTNASEISVSNYVVMNVSDKKVEFVLDQDGRATSKTVYVWNNNSNNWEPSYRYTADYGSDKHTLTYAKWNSNNHSFSKNIESVTYSSSEYPSLIVLPKY